MEDGTQLAIASQKDFKEKDGQQAEQTETGKSKSEYGGQRTIDDIDRNWRSKSNCDQQHIGKKREISKTGRCDEYTGDRKKAFLTRLNPRYAYKNRIEKIGKEESKWQKKVLVVDDEKIMMRQGTAF